MLIVSRGKMPEAKRLAPVLAVLLAVACSDHTVTSPDAQISATVDLPPVLLAAGDIAGCSSSFRDDQTAVLLGAEPDAIVVPLGDLAYPDGTMADFVNCYGPSWGQYQSRSLPGPGNHEYHTAGASTYFDYFNGVGVDSGLAGHRDRGYYAKNVGAWRVYVINSEANTGATGPQLAWLKADLAANPRTCVAAFWHRPWFTSSAKHLPESSMKAFAAALVSAGADVVLAGHNHHYERFARQTADGVASSSGIRAFVVGTGGHGTQYDFLSTPSPNSEVRGKSWGVLKLTLHPDRYDWRFLPIAGQTFTDAGSTLCSGATAPPPPTIALTVEGEVRADGRQYMTLDWTGAAGASLDVFRNGALITTTANDGHYTNSRSFSGPATYVYKVCQTGTATCSNEATVEFGGGTPAPPPPIALTASGRSQGGKQFMTLDWTGASGTTVDVYRNGQRITSTANDGHYVNSRTFTGSATYIYKVCNPGTTACSNEATVVFP